MKYGRLGSWYQWNATWLPLCSSPFTSTHIPSLSCTSCLLLSTYPCCSLAHTHTHTKAGAINLPKSAAGIETPKDRAYAVFGENADVPASSASSSVPVPSLSSSSFYTPSFYPLDLPLEFSCLMLFHALNPFQPQLVSHLLRCCLKASPFSPLVSI